MKINVRLIYNRYVRYALFVTLLIYVISRSVIAEGEKEKEPAQLRTSSYKEFSLQTIFFLGKEFKDPNKAYYTERSLDAISPDGSNLRKLAENVSDYSVSPDGSKIAIIEDYQPERRNWGEREREWLFQLSLINIDGSGRTVLVTRLHEPSCLAWLPNGQELIYAASYSRSWYIYIVAIKNPKPRRLVEGLRPRVSPDGQKILFRYDPRLKILNIDGSVFTIVKRRGDNGIWQEPTIKFWFPNGRTIGYAIHDEKGDAHTFFLYKVNIDGSNRKNLSDIKLEEGNTARVSPDGKKIAFLSSFPPLRMYIMDVDGSNLESIVASQFRPERSSSGGVAGGDKQLDWSPDSQNIVAVADDGLYTMNIYSRKPIRILKTYDKKPISTKEKVQLWSVYRLTWSK